MIDPNRICNVRKSNISNNVCCASNDAIIYYAESEQDARDFIEQWQALKDSFKD